MVGFDKEASTPDPRSTSTDTTAVGGCVLNDVYARLACAISGQAIDMCLCQCSAHASVHAEFAEAIEEHLRIVALDEAVLRI